MSRDYRLYLEDILEAIRKIEKYTENLSYNQFINEELIIDGIIKNLLVIGEAVKNLPANLRENYPQMEWKKIAGLRDVLIHNYYSLEPQILWQIITEKVPELKRFILKIR